jgi:hypothetical protein
MTARRGTAVPLLLGAACLIAFLLVSNRRAVGNLCVQLQHLQLNEDDVMRNDLRLRPIVDALPPHGVFGWISDASDTVTRQYQDQYALAPRVLEVGVARDLIVGDFDQDPTPALRARQLRVVKSFGNGLFLLSR